MDKPIDSGAIVPDTIIHFMDEYAAAATRILQYFPENYGLNMHKEID